MSFGFIVCSFLNKTEHQEALENCLNSILKYHNGVKIVVIVDNKSAISLVKNVMDKFPDVKFELDGSNRDAEHLCFEYFKKNKYFQKAIILQDSMLVRDSFDVSNINTVKYIWGFRNHRIWWHVFTEPETVFNKANNIVVHDDLNMYVINNLIEDEDFKKYCIEKYPKKREWDGCFGCRCIIDHDFLCNLDKLTGIIKTIGLLNGKRLRMCAENIFALACQYYLCEYIYEHYDGLAVDGEYIVGAYFNNFESRHIKKIVGFDR